MKKWSPFFAVLLCITAYCSFAQNSSAKLKEFRPAEVWNDTDSNVLNAHGGAIIFINKTYYWFGEKRGRGASGGVNVYSSTDLYNWKFEALALSPTKITPKVILREAV